MERVLGEVSIEVQRRATSGLLTESLLAFVISKTPSVSAGLTTRLEIRAPVRLSPAALSRLRSSMIAPRGVFITM